MAVFMITSSVLTLFDGIRKEINHVITRIKQLRDGVMKHSTPLTGEFFFRNENAADRVTLVGVVVNLLLSAGKFFIGVTCNSSALIADAGHSLSDLFSDFITLWAVQIGRLPPDDDHPYGHGKFEAVGSLFLALTLLGTGLSVGAVSNRKLIDIISLQRSQGFAAAASLAGQVPTPPALAMAGLSILSKEWLYRVTRRVGEELNSQIVIANAWHHRSDAYSSVLALISIGLAMSVPGLLAADAFAGLLVAGMICMTGAEILGESIKQLTDTSDEALVGKVAKLVNDSEDVLDVKRIRARRVGSAAMVDVSLCTPEGLSKSANHALEERLRWRIMEQPGVVDAEVHATGPDVVCPLLVADSGVREEQKSVSEVESSARQLLFMHPDVNSVKDVTVHYQDTVLVSVDATIELFNPGTTTVARANEIAGDIRDRLESAEEINKANIFLDLNNAAVVTP